MKTYRIKPLKWKREKKDEYTSSALKVRYSVFKITEGVWRASYLMGYDFKQSTRCSKEDAMQACQDQYEKELRECIEEV